MKHFAGKLSVDRSQSQGPLRRDWSDHHIILHFANDTGTGPALREMRVPVASDGSYQLRLSDVALSDKRARLSFLAPSGEQLATRLLNKLIRDQGNQLDVVELPRPLPGFVPSRIGLAARTHQKVTGRIMTPAGSAGGYANRSVSLQIKYKDRDPEVVWSGTTDKLGYFTTEIRNSGIELAAVILTDGSDTHTLDILIGPDGALPEPLILIAKLDIAAPECGCEVSPPMLPDAVQLANTSEVFTGDLGTCQPMTIPNRTLEEFDFFQIVRTTDPAIRGMRLPSNERTKRRGDEMHKIVFDSGTLAQATGASNIMLKQDAAGGLPIAERDVDPRFRSAERLVRGLDTTRVDTLELAGRLRAQISVDPLAVTGVATSALWRAAATEDVAPETLDQTLASIPSAMLATALEDPDGFTPDKVMTVERRAASEAVRGYLSARAQTAPGRGPLNEDNRIDWDHTPEFYQATSVAHGHILQFKQEWKADGYSLGDLVQSIPLAPGQQKQIVTLDWDRDDRTSRSELSTSSEELEAGISRDRDINEVISSTFGENISGNSSAKTGAVGGGLGLAIGLLVIGGGGGSGWSSSSASQDSTRRFSAESMNSLRDQTSQSVSAVRNQRSTVVNTVAQNENVTATTEIIANYNRCHALTIQYFEVLRHFAVQERLAGVKECLFVPLEMSLFDDAKVIRWRQILRRATRSRSLRRGFEAIERLSSPDTTPPNRRFADDPIETMSGRLRFRVAIARPKDPDEASRAVLESTQWGFLGAILRINPETIYDRYARNDAKKDTIFQTEIAPKVAREYLNSLQVYLIDKDGGEHAAEFDVTVTSRYQENGIMEVVLNDNAVSDRVPRAEIVGVEVRSDQPLPEYSKVILEDARITYRTERMGARLVSRRRILDDVAPGDPAFVDTSDMTWLEERNQLAFDRKKRRRLLKHLNDNIEYFHRAIWLGMDQNRRFMLLDGFEAPNANGRSIASVVENRVIGVLGNCLVMPVAPGFQLDPVLREVLEDEDQSGDVLTKLYSTPPSPPRRHSAPSRGVFGEAVPGTCNSCEVIEEDRFWRWSEYPLPDSPPAIASLSTDSRYAAATGLSPTPYPDALIKYQTVPDAPNPTGMAAALDVLGKDVFKDLTGLSQNQKNALAALTASMTSAEAFAGEAFELAMARDKAMSLDRTLGQIESAMRSRPS